MIYVEFWSSDCDQVVEQSYNPYTKKISLDASVHTNIALQRRKVCMCDGSDCCKRDKCETSEVLNSDRPVMMWSVNLVKYVNQVKW